jgi:hypothetical protein
MTIVMSLVSALPFFFHQETVVVGIIYSVPSFLVLCLIRRFVIRSAVYRREDGQLYVSPSIIPLAEFASLMFNTIWIITSFLVANQVALEFIKP